MDVFGSIAYHEINDIQFTVYSRVKVFNDAIDIYSKEGYCEDITLWDPFLLVTEVRKSGSNMHLEGSLLEKVAQEAW